MFLSVSDVALQSENEWWIHRNNDGLHALGVYWIARMLIMMQRLLSVCYFSRGENYCWKGISLL